MAKRRKSTPEFKAQVCRDNELKSELISRSKTTLQEGAAGVFQGDEQRSQEQARIADLERLVGRQALELEILKKPPGSGTYPRPKTGDSHATDLSLPGPGGLCGLGTAASSFYYPGQEPDEGPLKAAIEQVLEEFPTYGYTAGDEATPAERRDREQQAGSPLADGDGPATTAEAVEDSHN